MEAELILQCAAIIILLLIKSLPLSLIVSVTMYYKNYSKIIMFLLMLIILYITSDNCSGCRMFMNKDFA